MRNEQDDLLTALRDRWGEHWKIWLVYCYPGPDTWCAHRWGDEKHVINAARAARDDYPAWLAQAAATGGCSRPVRLRGQLRHIDPAAGEILRTLSTADAPDGVIYTACGDRRASVCPACAETYRADTYQLIRAGLVRHRATPRQAEGLGYLLGPATGIRTVRMPGTGEITDTAVACYLAKYATKSTEAVGPVAVRITPGNLHAYASPFTHHGRLIRAAPGTDSPGTPIATRTATRRPDGSAKR